MEPLITLITAYHLSCFIRSAANAIKLNFFTWEGLSKWNIHWICCNNYLRRRLIDLFFCLFCFFVSSFLSFLCSQCAVTLIFALNRFTVTTQGYSWYWIWIVFVLINSPFLLIDLFSYDNVIINEIIMKISYRIDDKKRVKLTLKATWSLLSFQNSVVTSIKPSLNLITKW